MTSSTPDVEWTDADGQRVVIQGDRLSVYGSPSMTSDVGVVAIGANVPPEIVIRETSIDSEHPEPLLRAVADAIDAECPEGKTYSAMLLADVALSALRKLLPRHFDSELGHPGGFGVASVWDENDPTSDPTSAENPSADRQSA